MNTRFSGRDRASRRSVTAYACACLLRDGAYEMRPAPNGASLASSSSAAVGGSTAESSGSGVSGSDGSPRGLTSPTRSGATATAALRLREDAASPPLPPNSLPPRGLTSTETASYPAAEIVALSARTAAVMAATAGLGSTASGSEQKPPAEAAEDGDDPKTAAASRAAGRPGTASGAIDSAASPPRVSTMCSVPRGAPAGPARPAALTASSTDRKPAASASSAGSTSAADVATRAEGVPSSPGCSCAQAAARGDGLADAADAAPPRSSGALVRKG